LARKSARNQISASTINAEAGPRSDRARGPGGHPRRGRRGRPRSPARRLPRLSPRATPMIPKPIATERISPVRSAAAVDEAEVAEGRKRIEVAVGREAEDGDDDGAQARVASETWGVRGDGGRMPAVPLLTHASSLRALAAVAGGVVLLTCKTFGGTADIRPGVAKSAGMGVPPEIAEAECGFEGSWPSGRRGRKRITSRIASSPEISITRRSRPMPRPPVGGRPYSRAFT